jgi:transcription termination factor Rho
MPSVLDRSALEQSPLADLHLLANELGVDGFRRLRKSDLVDAIIARQSGDDVAEPEVAEPEPDVVEAAARPVAEAKRDADADADADSDEEPRRSRRGRRGGRGRSRRDEGEGDSQLVDRDEPVAEAAPDRGDRDRGDERAVEGAVELLANGSGFLRLAPPEPTDDDVYISAAQVKRCELVSGDRVSGPVRAPRRSERFPSLIRVDTINGRPADEVAEGTRFEDLPVAWPDTRIELGSGDPTVKAIEWLTPFGKGSRVVIAGPSRSGKSEALRRLAEALAARPELEVSSVLTGVRPEEIVDWNAGPVVPGAALTFAASVDAQGQAAEQAVEQGRRVAARGGDAVVLIDSLEYLSAATARRVLAAGRNLRDGGSLTVIATAPAAVGGETTVVALDADAAALGRFPALALAESGTLRPELLVGEAGAAAIRAAATDGAPSPVAPAAEPEPEVAEAPAEAAKPAAKKAAAKRKPAARKRKPAAPKAE